MDYEIVNLPKKRIIGLCTTTNNTASNMGEKISSLWNNLYSRKIEKITDTINANTYGLYTNYASDVTGDYDVIAGREVALTATIPTGFVEKEIPTGKYAKFSFIGDAQKGVGILWNSIWATQLKRSYTVDFEEYLPYTDATHAGMNIYISID